MMKVARCACVIMVVLFSIFLCTADCFSGGEGSLPVPDGKGDYWKRTTHRFWMVVDRDHHGLNGRLSKEFPSNWEDPRSEWPKQMNIDEWPVVARFSRGSILNGTGGNMGIIFVKDIHGDSWMMVNTGINRICFVRANSRYIKPVVVIDDSTGTNTHSFLLKMTGEALCRGILF